MSRSFTIHELPEHQIGLHTLLMEVHYKPYIAYGDHIQNLKNEISGLKQKRGMRFF